MSELVMKQCGGACGLSRTARIVLMVMLLWFSAILVIALNDGFAYSAGQRPVSILLAFSMPVVVFAMVYLTLSSFRQWVLALDMRRLILLHSWRMLGMGFVFLYFQQQLPAVFALPAGIGDALTAVGAVVLGIALYENVQGVPAHRIWWWNSLGLLDFFVAVTLGVLSRSGDVLHVAGQASSDIMGSFPQAIVPGFFVPFFMITHLIVFAQLRRRQGVVFRNQD